MLSKALFVVVLSAVWLAVPSAQSQPAEGGGRGGGGAGGGGRRGGWGGRGQGMDPAAMQERMLGRLKEKLGPTDEEWQVIEPLLKAVAAKQWEIRRSMFSGMRRRFRGGAAEDTPPEVTALQAAVDGKETPAKEIQEKLAAYRAAEKKRAEETKQKEQELKKAREDLRKVLTIRQEAVLVMQGTLD